MRSVQLFPSLWPHESQHARPPYPSQTPRVYSNSCPSSRWCHPAISSSVVPFSSCPQSLPASGSFQMSPLFTWGGQRIGVSASTSVHPMTTQDLSPSGWTGWISLQFNILYWCFFSSLLHLYNGLQFHPPHQNWFKWILFNGWEIFHCVYVPQLSYPFVCWWASRLLPCPGYYKQCCDEHWGTCVSFRSGLLGVYAQDWDCWVIWQFYFQFFKESPHCSP